MARQYVVTEEEMLSLIESLELEKMRMDGHFRQMDASKQEIQDVHRAFHLSPSAGFRRWAFRGYANER